MKGFPKGFETWPEHMTASDLAEAFDVSQRTASNWMNQDGFPLLHPGHRRNRKVNKFRLIEFLRGGNYSKFSSNSN